MSRAVKLGMIAAVLFMLAFFSGVRLESQDPVEELLKEAIAATDHLKAGERREAVERDFVLDGGLQIRENSRYVFRKCHFIKVTVAFLQDGNSGSRIEESPADKVLSVSKPYLEYPFMD